MITWHALAWRLMSGTSRLVKQQQAPIGWYDTVRKAGMWFGQSTIKPREAALLLCHLHPASRTDPTEEREGRNRTI